MSKGLCPFSPGRCKWTGSFMHYWIPVSCSFQACEELGVPLEGVFTHFADSWDNLEFTRQQLDTFYKCIEPYRSVIITFSHNACLAWHLHDHDGPSFLFWPLIECSFFLFWQRGFFAFPCCKLRCYSSWFGYRTGLCPSWNLHLWSISWLVLSLLRMLYLSLCCCPGNHYSLIALLLRWC